MVKKFPLWWVYDLTWRRTIAHAQDLALFCSNIWNLCTIHNGSMCWISGQDGTSVFVGIPSGFGISLPDYVYYVPVQLWCFQRLFAKWENHFVLRSSISYKHLDVYIAVAIPVLCHRGFAHHAGLLLVPVELLQWQCSQQRKKVRKKVANQEDFWLNIKKFDALDLSPVSELCPFNYLFFNLPRTSGRGGGIATVYQNHFKCSQL